MPFSGIGDPVGVPFEEFAILTSSVMVFHLVSRGPMIGFSTAVWTRYAQARKSKETASAS